MLAVNRSKLILAKLKIAEDNNKKVLKIKLFFTDLPLLDLLWKNGFIYGYTYSKNFYFIFLKYNLKGLGLLHSTFFFDIKLSKKDLSNYLKLDSYYSYLVWTVEGLVIYSLKNQMVMQGGILIAKL